MHIISEGLQAFQYGWNQYIIPQHQILRNRLNQYLTPQQQMIAAVALAILSSLAMIYMISRCLRKHQVQEEHHQIESELSPISEEAFPLETKEIKTTPQVMNNSIKEQIGKVEKIDTGFGSITFPEGEKWKGGFERGLLQGRGQINFSDGRTLEGTFDAGRPIGEVKMIFPEGDVWKGVAKFEDSEEEIVLFQVESDIDERKDEHTHSTVIAPIYEEEKEITIEIASPTTAHEEQREEGEEQAAPLDEEIWIDDKEKPKEQDSVVLESSVPAQEDSRVEDHLAIAPTTVVEKKKEDEEKPPDSPPVSDERGIAEGPATPLRVNRALAEVEKKMVTREDAVQAQASGIAQEQQEVVKVETLATPVKSPKSRTEEKSTVEGNFTPGRKNGQGKIVLPTGDLLEGTFIDGQLECEFGRSQLVDRTVREGKFKGGKLNGYGKITFENGDWQTGEFVEGELNGSGTMKHTEGGIEYTSTGYFKNGKLEGQGTRQYIKEGKEFIMVGKFVNGVLDQDAKPISSPARPQSVSRLSQQPQTPASKKSPKPQTPALKENSKPQSPKVEKEDSPLISMDTVLRLFGRKPKVKPKKEGK